MAGLTIDYPRRTIYGVDAPLNADLSQIPITILMRDVDMTTATNTHTSGGFMLEAPSSALLQANEAGMGVYINIDYDGFTAGTFLISAVLDDTITTTLVFETAVDGPWSSGQTANVYLSGLRPVSVTIHPHWTPFVGTPPVPLVPNEIPFNLDSTGHAFIDFAGIMYGVNEGKRFQNIAQWRVTAVYDDTWGTVGASGSGGNPVCLGLPSQIKQLGDVGGSAMWEYLQSSQGLEIIGSVVDPAVINEFDIVINSPTISPIYVLNDYYELNAPPYVGVYKLIFKFVDPSTTVLTFEGDYIGDFTGTNNTVSNIGGQLLTEAETLRAWKGWNRFVSVPFDATIIDRIDVSFPYTVNFNFIEQDANKTLISDSVGVDIALDSLVPIVHDELIPQPTDAGTKFTEVQLFDDASNVCNKTQYFEWQDDCQNGIMLDWINRAGGFEQHLFSVNQGVKTVVEQGIVYENQIQATLDVATSNINRTVNKKRQEITLRAEKLPLEYWKSITSITESSVVNMWLDKTGTKKIGVIVKTGLTQSFQTKDRLPDFSLTIQLPPNFNAFR